MQRIVHCYRILIPLLKVIRDFLKSPTPILKINQSTVVTELDSKSNKDISFEFFANIEIVFSCMILASQG